MSSLVLKKQFFSFYIAQCVLKRVDISAYKPFSFLEVICHHMLELEDGKTKMGSRTSFKEMSCNQESSTPSLFLKTWSFLVYLFFFLYNAEDLQPPQTSEEFYNAWAESPSLQFQLINSCPSLCGHSIQFYLFFSRALESSNSTWFCNFLKYFFAHFKKG